MGFNNNEKLLAFAKYITKLRKEYNYTLVEVAKKTNIDKSSLHKIENGEFQKINSLFLMKLAELYDVNVLTFHLMLGYVKEDDIIKLSEILKNKNYFKNEKSTQNLKIPIFRNKETLLNNSHKRFLKISNSSNDFFAIYISKKYFIFKITDVLIQNDIGIFDIDDSIIIARYAVQDNFVSIVDIITNKIFFKNKNEITTLGKVFYIIDIL